MKIRTREEVIVAIADELMASGRFEDYVKASVWATRVYQTAIVPPVIAEELQDMYTGFADSLKDSMVYGVEPKSMHKVFLHYNILELFRAFLSKGHV